MFQKLLKKGVKSLRKKTNTDLQKWQERLAKSQSAYAEERKVMGEREALYQGTRDMDRGANSEAVSATKKASYVRNIVAEIIEAQVDSNIPQPKVTARYQKDEDKAKMLEDFLRNELDRLPFEYLNDMDERTTPLQGGDIFLVEWDSKRHTHTTVGELVVSVLHPKQVIPQNGVTNIEDMDYIFIQMAQTKEYIKQKYGVDVSEESEENPDSRSNRETKSSDSMVTQNIVYYRNTQGGIGRYSWVNDEELENIEDYQARRLRRCKSCGQPVDGEACQYCGSKSIDTASEEFEELTEDIVKNDGTVIKAATEDIEEAIAIDPMTGIPEVMQQPVTRPTQLPYYKPGVYPLVLRKNVSVFGQFLGDSDADKIRDQQNLIKKLGTKIEEKLLKGGSYVTFPRGVNIRKTDEELKVIELQGPQDKAMIDVLNIQPDISADANYFEHVYQDARNTIGITDSFQGRKDATATSGKAKEFAAAQSAGRLESKRTMKNAAYATLFEVMFKFLLAYADEPRPVVTTNVHGQKEYKTFNRYDFLEQDAAGEWYWNDEFLFSVDNTAPLANNREAMWQETRMNYQSGTFGDPTQIETQILFWTKMERLHYPDAGDTKAYLEERLQRQREEQAQMQAQAMGPPMAGMQEGPQIPQEALPQQMPRENVMPIQGGNADVM